MTDQVEAPGAPGHLSVMRSEVVELLGCASGSGKKIYVDATLGGGGHARAILEASAPNGTLIGIDRDRDALNEAGKVLRGFGNRVSYLHGNYRDARSLLSGIQVSGVDGILLDLGVSSFQLDRAERGFSFRFDAPLDMRMDATQKLTAYDIVNERDEQWLEGIFTGYGEERYARRIASAICRVRQVKPIETTFELARIVLDVVPKKMHFGRIHPATRVFQAIRIAVNDEINGLNDGLKGAIDILNPGGVLAVISFHSLEDRAVKEMFRNSAAGCICPPRIPKCVCGNKPVVRLLTRRAIVPSEAEIALNPRSRSAKLRAVSRI